MAAAETTSRMDVLSRAKRLHPLFLKDRPSVYWIDKFPPRPEADGTTAFMMTTRLEQLAAPKPLNRSYQGHRQTPIWRVGEGALNAEATPRVEDLARHRPVHDDYKYMRSVYTEVSSESKAAEAGPRLEFLAQPKPHKIWANSNDTVKDGDFSEPITNVPLPAIQFGGSVRLDALSEAKMTHDLYQSERPVQWPVSENAMNTQASTRLQQLARPKSGRLRKDDYDPYKVTVGARLARPTPRITELSLPLERKQRQKKA